MSDLERVDLELQAAQKELQGAFDGRMAGPSGWRSQAMAHVRQARLLLNSLRASQSAPALVPAPPIEEE